MIEFALPQVHSFLPDSATSPVDKEQDAWAFEQVGIIKGYDDLKGHTLKVTRLALALGETDGIGVLKLQQMRRAALLHDIGKLDLPEPLFSKHDLTPDERGVVESHVMRSYIKVFTKLPEEAAILLGHHRFQMDGYPRGIDWTIFTEETQRLQLLLFLADQTDARLTKRAYHDPQPVNEVREELIKLTREPRLVGEAIATRLLI